MKRRMHLGMLLCTAVALILIGSQSQSLAAATVNWKMYLYTGTINPATQIMQAFAKDIAAKTNGGFQIAVYPAGELPYSATQMLQIVHNRDVELADGLGGFIAGQLPLIGVFDQPFLITDSEQFKKAWAVAAPYLSKRLNQFNASILFPYSWPVQNVWSITPINRLDDIRGKKIRCTNREQTELISLLGGSPVTMTTAEVPAAAQRGVIDGVLSAGYPILGAKWSDFLRYGYLLNMNFAPSFVLMNKKAYEELPAEYKKVLDETAVSYSDRLLKEIPTSKEQEARHTLKQQGMTLVDASSEERARAKNLIKPHWSIWAKGNGPDAVEMLQKVLKELSE